MFDEKHLPAAPDATAPDGSEVRLLLSLPRGGLAHFQLPAGETSVAVRHRTVEEIWYFLGGRGVMWRRDDEWEEEVAVGPGDAITIPVETCYGASSSRTGMSAPFDRSSSTNSPAYKANPSSRLSIEASSRRRTS